MKEACLQAGVSIDIEQFILENEGIGEEFIKLFIQKRKEGVKVRVLCDMVGSYPFFNSKVPSLLREHGIEVRFFNIVRPWKIQTIFSWFFRDHRKILIVDSQTGFIGGVGMREDMRGWRDTHIKVSGSIVEEMHHAFEEMWRLAKARTFNERRKRARSFSKQFQFITNSPYFKKRFLYYKLIEVLRSAHKSIYITTPYFVPDRRLIRVLSMAALRGVDVVILIPEKSNHPMVDRASRIFFDRLLRSGVHIYLYRDSMIHAKTVVIDGEWATIGSFNMDSLSFIWNFEANIVGTSKVFVKEIEGLFKEDLMRSNELTLLEWRDRPLHHRVLEKSMVPFRKFL